MWLVREKQNRENLAISINRWDFIKYFMLALLVCIIACADNVYLDITCTCVGGIIFFICNRFIIMNVINKIKL